MTAAGAGARRGPAATPRAGHVRPIGRPIAVALAAVAAGALAAARPADAVVAVDPARRVVVIVFENKEYDSIVGRPDAPYFNRLASENALATSYYGLAHPSSPNYQAMTYGRILVGGNDEGWSTSEPLLATQMHDAGLPWMALFESMPDDATPPCPFPSSGRYRKKHNPFAFSSALQNDGWGCRSVRAYAVPEHLDARFTFVVPDMCNSMHDCPVAAGDAWLAREAPRWLALLDGPGDLLIVTFDEGTTSLNGGGRIYTAVAGRGARKAVQDPTFFDHYSLLKTLEYLYGLPYLGRAADADVAPLTSMLER